MKMDPERIKQIIAAELTCEGLHVDGDGEVWSGGRVQTVVEGVIDW